MCVFSVLIKTFGEKPHKPQVHKLQHKQESFWHTSENYTSKLCKNKVRDVGKLMNKLQEIFDFC